MPQPKPLFDVLVIGNHPASLLASALLAQNSSLQIAHASFSASKTPHPPVTLLNPELFNLDPLLKPLKRKIPATLIHGVRFLNPEKSLEARSNASLSSIVLYKDVQTQFQQLASKFPIQFLKPKTLQLLSLSNHAHLLIDDKPLFAKILILANPITPKATESSSLRIRASLSFKPSLLVSPSPKSLLSLSLNLQSPNHFAQLLPGKTHLLFNVDLPANSTLPIPQLMSQWVELLLHHKIIHNAPRWSPDQLIITPYPSAGALSHDCVSNQTLLIGPAGGFYSSTGEDLLPNCWSALFAADAAKKALRHHNQSSLQDALNAFRSNWGATLGHYLRPPHENLNYLLPLIFHNPLLAQRAASTILQGPKAQPQ